MVKEIGGKLREPGPETPSVLSQIEDDRIRVVQRSHRSGSCGPAYGRIGKSIELQVADVVRQDFDLLEPTVILLEFLSITRKVFGCRFRQEIRQRFLAIDHLQVHVMAHLSYLLGQQTGKGS